MIPIWQRLLGILIYMLPWSDALPFGRYLFIDFPMIQWITLPALPIILIQRGIPFGGLILFFILFLSVVRNSRVPYFLRFNTLQAILIDIAIILINYGFQIILEPFAGSLIISTLSSTILISVLAIVIFVTIKCLQGQEGELPGISEAVKIQLQ